MRKGTDRYIGRIVRGALGCLLVFAMLICCTSCAPFKAPIEEDELTVFMERGEDFKVLELADLHFGTEGAAYHNSDVERSLDFIDYAIREEKPDLIVLLGDNMMGGGTEGANFIVELFDGYEIPYTFVFGNHDTDPYTAGYTKRDVSKYLEECDSQYLLYKEGYVEEGAEDRYGNFSIALRDERTHRLVGAFVILDTGIYDYSTSMYQSINEGQIFWYEEEIARLDGIYDGFGFNPLPTVPTITYGHIQLPEFVDAYEKAKNEGGAEFVYYQELSARMMGGITGSAGGINYGFYDVMKRLGSSKAYLAGHMHGLNYHVRMDGMLLGFCPQACVTGNSDRTLTTFSYTINNKMEIELKLITEPEG